MRFKIGLLALLSFLLLTIGWMTTPPALALTQIKLSDISYTDCPPELADGNVTADGASMAAKCYLIVGKTNNPTRNPVFDADIYGRIYDANGNPVLQNRTRLGSIDEVPPGVGKFELRVTVAANQPTPLRLKQFKASGFASRVRSSAPINFDDDDFDF